MSTTDQAEEKITEMAENSAASKALALFTFNKSNAIIVALVLVIILLISANIGGNSVEQPAAAGLVDIVIAAGLVPVADIGRAMDAHEAAPVPGRRHLRSHESRRFDGTQAGSGTVRGGTRAEDRHHHGSDPLSHPQ